MFEVDFHILNQKATPAIYADTLANRPTASFAGRLFVDTASPYGIYRDTGSAWVQIAGNGGGGSSTGINGLNGTTNIGLGGTLINGTTINGGLNNLVFTNLNSFQSSSRDFVFQAVDINNQYSQINGGGGAEFLELYQLDNNLGVDTTLRIYKNKLSTTFSGNNYGLNLDDTTGKFVLGDYSNNRKYNSIVVNDSTDSFYFTTSYNQANTDQDLFYALNSSTSNRFVKIGDFNSYANNTSLIVDDANAWIYTTTSSGNNGFFITNDSCFFGSNNGDYIGLRTEVSSGRITARTGGNIIEGLNLDFYNSQYTLGGIVANNNFIIIDDVANSIENKTSSLVFTGAALQSNTSSGNSGEHLIITLNGTQYKIALQNP